MTADISRHFADAQKRYRALVHQQGRLPTDAEANHAEEIDEWQSEAQFREVIAELGSPDQGFRIAPVAGDTRSFSVLAGSMYADGARLSNPLEFEYGEQASNNWLTMADSDAIEAGERVFAWLEADTRLVTGAEDGELIDPAYRGADGAARARFAWRVRQMTSSLTECEAALETAIGPDAYAAYDSEYGVIRSSGTLRVGFLDDQPDLDLCKPTASGGYFGDRNATYRAKITGDGRLIWGEDNASALYRVQLGPGSDTITFLTHPKDEWQWPKTGQVVELLRGDVALGNLEKIAERDGALLRVTGSYANGAITIDTDDLPSDWPTWLAGLDASLFEAGTERFFYARLWSGGHEDGAVDWPYTPGTALALGESGLTVTLDGDLLKGDSWSFAARPDAPHQVLPWDMLDGMHSHAPRRFAIPLGFIDLTTGAVHDCRLRFRSLQRIQSCCTVTVGDGIVSRGDTDSIEDAIDLLPDTGGEICLLKGNHSANIELTGSQNISFSGCKGRAVWAPEDPALPALSLIDCSGIKVDGIGFEAGDVPAIIGVASDPNDLSVPVGNLTIADCDFNAPEGFALSVYGHDGLKLLRCTFKAGPYPVAPGAGATTGHSAVQIQGARLLVERCSIDATIGSQNPSQRAVGGIQVMGDSSGVAIRQCAVTEGAGTGIVLGSIHYEDVVDPGDPASGTVPTEGYEERSALEVATGSGYTQSQDARGCLKVETVPGGGVPDASGTVTQVPVSDGEVHEVLIEGNTISGMGANGIGTYPLGLFGLNEDPALDAISVDQLQVVGNRIVSCRRNEVDASPALEFERLFTPNGGVALSIVSNGLFRENHIEGCGLEDGRETCGIGVSYGEMLRFEDNVILGNGRQDPAVTPTGPNSAIEVRFATGGLPTITSFNAGLRGSDRPALSILNNLIDAPAGRAIRSLARGPVRVTDNRLVGGNPSRVLSNAIGTATGLFDLIGSMPEQIRIYGLLDAVLDFLGGDCVNIANLGLAEDAWSMLISMASDDVSEETCDLALGFGFVNALLNVAIPSALQGGGEILFTDNQVTLRRPSQMVDPVDQGGPETAASAMAAEPQKHEFAAETPEPMEAREGAAPAEARATESEVEAAAAATDPDSTAAPESDFTQAGLGTVSSIVLASLDDVYFGENQCEIESERILSFFHALLFGLTLRTQSNRMQEGGMAYRSIAGYGLKMHNASHNQTTACSYYGPRDASGTRAVNNQSIFGGFGS